MTAQHDLRRDPRWWERARSLVAVEAQPEPDDRTPSGLARHDPLELLATVEQISEIGSWHYDLRSRSLSASAAFVALHGLPDAGRAPGYRVVDQKVVRACIVPEDWAAIEAHLSRSLVEGAGNRMRYRARRPSDHALRWFDARLVLERDAGGTVIGYLGTSSDVTGLVNSEERLREAHAELIETYAHQQAVIAATPDAIHVYEVATGQIVRANRVPRPLAGFSPAAAEVICGENVADWVPSEDQERLWTAFTEAATAEDGAVIKMRHRVGDPDTGMSWVSRRMTPFQRDEAGRVRQLLVISRDVTDVVSIEQRLEYAALHDELTGLANRRLLHDRLQQALHRTARGGRVAVLIADLDGFKRINDGYGHRAGDEVLRTVTTRLSGTVRSADSIARMGGDEFAIVLDIPEHEDPIQSSEHIAARIVAAVGEPIEVDGSEHIVSVSLGLAIADDDATPAGLVTDADAAMYYIKTRGGNGYALFEQSQRPDTTVKDNLERQLRRALSEDAIGVHYQPIVDPRTDRVYGVEALLRVSDESGHPLDTAALIEVAEHTGLIAAVDEQVLRKACAQAVHWRHTGALPNLMLKINRSVRDITRPGFGQRIAAALAESGLEPGALTLEITETVLLDASADNLADLRDLAAGGVGLAIDDFGTGYASLRYLAELPISCIKIDRSFTAELTSNPTAMTLVRATIGLAEQLGITCVVEGVETVDQLLALPAYAQLLIQGYLYARPQSPALPLATHIRPAGA